MGRRKRGPTLEVLVLLLLLSILCSLLSASQLSASYRLESIYTSVSNMSYLWKCQDLFEDRNQIFGASYQPDGSPPTSGSPPNTFPGSFNRRTDSYRTVSFNMSPMIQNQQEFRMRRERTASSSSDSASSFTEPDVFRKPEKPKQIGPRYCTFCKTNGEVKEIYGNHSLKAFRNNKFVVECPVLRKLKCRICGATGDDAHTITHCPKGSVVVPIAKELKNISYSRKK